MAECFLIAKHITLQLPYDEMHFSSNMKMFDHRSNDTFYTEM